MAPSPTERVALVTGGGGLDRSPLVGRPGDRIVGTDDFPTGRRARPAGIEERPRS